MRLEMIPKAFQYIGIALAAAAIAGCATQPTPLGTELASKLKRVSVVSMVARSFTRQYTGLTVFGNEAEEMDISDWKIDEQYEEQIGQALESRFGMTVVRAPYSSAEFSRVNDLNGPWDAPAFWGPNWAAIESATKRYCADNSLDAVLVMAKSKTGDFLAQTNQSFGGAGIYARGPVHKVAVMHLISKMALLDCATGKPLAIRPLAKKQSGFPSEIVQSQPLSFRDSNESRIPIGQWAPEYRQRIRSELAKLPREAIAETLKSILPGNGKL